VELLSLALEAAPKALVYGAAMLAAGACIARGLLVLRVRPAVGVRNRDLFDAALARVVVMAAGCLVAALVLRAWAHTAAAFGLGAAFSWEPLRLVALESRWGVSWQKQIVGAVLLLALTRSIEPWGRTGWWLTAAGSLTLCYLLPLLGHASGEPGRVLLHGSHILGGGVWLGTLSATVIASRSPAADTPANAWRQVRREMLARFSPVAFSGSTLLLVTGGVAVWWYLGPVISLWTTAYGRLLVLKLTLVLAVATCGFLNWRRLRVPAAPGDPDSSSVNVKLIAAEIMLAVAVVLVTAVLTETEHP
jgi:putative copper export protein